MHGKMFHCESDRRILKVHFSFNQFIYDHDDHTRTCRMNDVINYIFLPVDLIFFMLMKTVGPLPLPLVHQILPNK